MSSSFKVTITSVVFKDFDVEVTAETTVGELKALVAEQTGVAPKLQGLFHRGVEMGEKGHHYEPLDTYFIAAGSRIKLLRNEGDDKDSGDEGDDVALSGDEEEDEEDDVLNEEDVAFIAADEDEDDDADAQHSDGDNEQGESAQASATQGTEEDTAEARRRRKRAELLDGVDTSNIIEGRRTRRAPERYIHPESHLKYMTPEELAELEELEAAESGTGSSSAVVESLAPLSVVAPDAVAVTSAEDDDEFQPDEDEDDEDDEDISDDDDDDDDADENGGNEDASDDEEYEEDASGSDDDEAPQPKAKKVKTA